MTVANVGSGGRRQAVRTTVAAALALAAATVPVFLFGALSGSIGAELGFGRTGAGGAVTVFFVAAALGAVPLGHVTERIGARAAIRTGVVTSAVVCLAIAGLARTWWQVAALLGVVGGSIGLIDTGTARALTERVRTGRQGLAFGVKESSVPLGSMLAGASVPLLGLRYGWRPTFALAAVLAPVVWIVVAALPARPSSGRALREGSGAPVRDAAEGVGSDTRPRVSGVPVALVVLTVGVALGSGAATAAATFLVPAVSAGAISAGAAGTLLAGASLIAVVVRLVVGTAADRGGPDPIAATSGAMVLGAVGGLALAVAEGPAAVAAAAALLLGAGWGWTGLAFLAAVRIRPAAPAAAAGVVLSGLALGGAAGPLVFGAVAAGGSYSPAWRVVAAALALGAVTTSGARLALRGAGRAP